MRALRAVVVGAVGAVLVAACQTGSANTIAGAATMTTLAVGAAAANRAAGGCIAVCTAGTYCNPKSGLCEILPCRGQCNENEHCEDNFAGGKCVPGSTTGVEAVARTNEAKLPINAVPVSDTDTSGPPKVVPKAEQEPPRTRSDK